MSLSNRIAKIEGEIGIDEQPYSEPLMIVLDEDVKVARTQIKQIGALGPGYLDVSGEPFIENSFIRADKLLEKFSTNKPKGPFIQIHPRGQ